jgi:hypothetical protein
MGYQHFRRLAQSIDVAPIVAELRAERARWYVHQVRRETVPAQAQTNDIGLRHGLSNASTTLENSQNIVETENWRHFPHTTSLLTRFANDERGELARAMLVRLKPQGRVLPHIDHGAYYACRDRYHLVIHSPGGSEMKAGDETVLFQAGELWCFNNKTVHAAFNKSNDWRIHLIFDLRPIDRPLHYPPRQGS